jgi:hydrogenase expression/formation protein HypE
MAHGGGGRMTQRLVDEVFAPAFDDPCLRARHDAADVDALGGRLAITTDGYVVRPLFFPGGDIGALAVNGTVNDLAMAGARPLYLTAGFILEEGLPMETLRRVVRSMAAAARAAGVRIVAGDTKVVDRGQADGLFVTTAGVGEVVAPGGVSPARVRPGDALLVSGDVGRHGVAVLSVREGIAFDTPVESDCAPLWGAVSDLLAAGIDAHCLRDLTRGGFATAAVEVAQTGGVSLRVEEDAVPVSDGVRAACEILGLDPFYVANEGRFAAFVPGAQAEAALAVLRRRADTAGAVRVGEVLSRGAGRVLLRGPYGNERLLELLSGEQLPRIC